MSPLRRASFDIGRLLSFFGSIITANAGGHAIENGHLATGFGWLAFTLWLIIHPAVFEFEWKRE